MRGFIFLAYHFSRPFIIVSGLVGNYLSLVLMKNPKYKNSTTCFYMRCLAFGDCLFVLFGMVIYSQYFTKDIILKSGYRREYCYFSLTIREFGSFPSPWILVVMALDRFTAVMWPLKAKSLCTLKRARMLVAIIFLINTTFAVLINFNNMVDESNASMCPYIWSKERPLLAAYIYKKYLPIACLFILNSGIIVVVQKGRQQREAMAPTSTNKNSETESSITKMMILVCLTFFVCSSPLTFQTLYRRHYMTHKLTAMARLVSQFMYSITSALNQANYAINFYIYIIGCKRFRLELKEYIISRCIGGKSSKSDAQ
jgi:hypothetical protein